MVRTTEILKAGRITCNRRRLIAEQSADPYDTDRKDSLYYAVTVKDGLPECELIAYYDTAMYNGFGGEKLIKPITEPLRQY